MSNNCNQTYDTSLKFAAHIKPSMMRNCEIFQFSKLFQADNFIYLILRINELYTFNLTRDKSKEFAINGEIRNCE